MKKITKIFAILFAYFCLSTGHILMVIFIPLAILMSRIDSRMNWRERRKKAISEALKEGAEISPRLSGVILAISIYIFWLRVLDKYVYIGDRTKVANSSIILLVFTLLPVVIWWIRNEDIVKDLDNNLRMGENHKLLWSVLSQLFFLLQLALPFVMLWLPI